MSYHNVEGGPAYSAEDVYNNLVGNYYKTGPNSKPRSGYHYAFSIGGHMYIKDNAIDDPDCGVDLFDNPADAYYECGHIFYYLQKNWLLDNPVNMPSVTTYPVLGNYKFVLENAGDFPRDVVTIRTINEVKTATGE